MHVYLIFDGDIGVGGTTPGSSLSKKVIVHDVQQQSKAQAEENRVVVSKPEKQHGIRCLITHIWQSQRELFNRFGNIWKPYIRA